MSLLGLLILLFMTTENAGAPDKAKLSFSPNSFTIFTSESVTMTCDGYSSARGDPGYSWYKDGSLISSGQQKYTIVTAQESDAGKYQCKTNGSDLSIAFSLIVTKDNITLKIPPLTFEGDDLYFTCAVYPGYEAGDAELHKGDQFINSSHSGNFHIGRATMEMSGTYKCYRSVKYKGTYNRESSLSLIITVNVLFPKPKISMNSDNANQINEEDPIMIKCDTKLSPHRETTELQFAFYRNGHNVQGFSLSNQYGVPSAQLEDSGNYTCEIKAQSGTVKKESDQKSIQIKAQKLSGVSVRLEPTGEQVISGERLEILCSVEKGIGLLSYSWCKQTSLSCDTKEAAAPWQRFVVESVSKDYGGEYQCTVTRAATQDSIQSANISISVQEKSYAVVGIGSTVAFLVLLFVTAIVTYKCRNCHSPKSSGDLVTKDQCSTGPRQQADDCYTTQDVTHSAGQPVYGNIIFQDGTHGKDVCNDYYSNYKPTAPSFPKNNSDDVSVSYTAEKSKSTIAFPYHDEPDSSIYENFSAS